VHLNRLKQQRRLIETGLKFWQTCQNQTQKLEGDAATKFAYLNAGEAAIIAVFCIQSKNAFWLAIEKTLGYEKNIHTVITDSLK
jgi:hypothetical protein